MTEDEIVGWYHQFTGPEIGQTLGDGEEQRFLTCSRLRCYKKLEMTWQPNKKNNNSKEHLKK